MQSSKSGHLPLFPYNQAYLKMHRISLTLKFTLLQEHMGIFTLITYRVLCHFFLVLLRNFVQQYASSTLVPTGSMVLGSKQLFLQNFYGKPQTHSKR